MKAERKNLCIHSPRRAEIVSDAVPKGTVGVYRLWNKNNNNFVIKYFGRSVDIRSRILKHSSKKDFTHFTFEETGDLEEAFRRECRDYHLEIPTVSNERHPGSTSSESQCTYCNTKFSWVSQIQKTKEMGVA